jgi:hypothetical protein
VRLRDGMRENAYSKFSEFYESIQGKVSGLKV